MAQNGWERLGSALAGASPARQEEIRQQTINALAQTDYNLARSRGAVQEQVKRESLGDTFAQIMADNPNARAYADASLAGVNLNELTNATGNIQQQGFRGSAVNAALGGDLGRANANLFGVASGPVQIPTVEGNTLISNRLIPGGGVTAPTSVGQSMISENLDRGQAALIRANRPPASRGGGSAAPKMSEIDNIRLKAAMDDLAPMIAAARNEIIANQGASPDNKNAQARLSAAQARLTQLQAQRDDIINTFGGGQPAPPAPTEWTSTGTGATRPLPSGYSVQLMEQLTGINRDRLREGLPPLTPEQARELRTTGGIREAAPQGAPRPGTVMQGYRFKGGDPGDRNNWERV